MLNHPSEKVEVVCPSFLIEHKRGLVLWDTGLYPGAAGDPAAVYGQALVDFLGIQFQPHQRVDRQIEALGFTMSDVKYVIASHLHFDHAGGLYLFPHAKIIVGAGEVPYALWPMSHHVGSFRREDILAISRGNVFEVAQDLDLFGDGSINVLRTPGHTPGSLSLFVRLPGRPFLLTGDAIHIREQVDTPLPLPDDPDARQAVRSIERICLLAAANEATMWIGHDLRDWTQHGAPGCFE
jgi:N-acyl homoserine lactone hydrolase